MGIGLNNYIKEIKMDKYICKVCATVYDPNLGILEDGIAPGTPFEQIPSSWMCTVCGAPKSSYVLLPEAEYQRLLAEKLIKKDSN